MSSPHVVVKDFIQNYKGPNVFFAIAGVSGALAVVLAAYGSHCKFLMGWDISFIFQMCLSLRRNVQLVTSRKYEWVIVNI